MVTGLVASSETQDPTCEEPITLAQVPMLLQPESVYLIEIRAAPGLQLAGDVGLYNA
jgi:hypothetical protein